MFDFARARLDARAVRRLLLFEQTSSWMNPGPQAKVATLADASAARRPSAGRIAALSRDVARHGRARQRAGESPPKRRCVASRRGARRAGPESVSLTIRRRRTAA